MQDTASAQQNGSSANQIKLTTAPLKEHRRNKPCNNVQHQAIQPDMYTQVETYAATLAVTA